MLDEREQIKNWTQLMAKSHQLVLSRSSSDMDAGMDDGVADMMRAAGMDCNNDSL